MRSRSPPRPISSSSLLRRLHAPLRPQVPLDEVAAALQAAGDEHAVDAALERGEYLLHLHLAAARHVDDAHVRRILHAPRAREVGGGVGAEVAAEREDLAAVRRRRLGLVSSVSIMSCSHHEQLVQHRRELPFLLVLKLDRLRPGRPRRSSRSPGTSPPGSRPCGRPASGAPYGQTFTQVMQAVQPRRRPCATWPPISRYGLRKDRRCPCRRCQRLRDRLVHEARRVRQPADEDALARQVDRPQLGVRLQEEAVGGQRRADHATKAAGCRPPARCRCSARAGRAAGASVSPRSGVVHAHAPGRRRRSSAAPRSSG